jgi:hypothetical protein
VKASATLGFFYTVSDGRHKANAMVVAKAIGIRGIYSVSFSGGHTLYSDPRPNANPPSTEFGPRQWLDANLDGTPERKWPYAYTRGSQLEVAAQFVLAVPWPDKAPTIYVKTEQTTGDANLKAQAVNVDAADRTKLLLASAKSDKTLPNVVNAYDSFQITWKLNSNSEGGQPKPVGWVSIGTTENPMYLTYANPVDFPRGDVRLWWTLVHLGSKNAKGEHEEAQVIAKIWEDFTGLYVKRVDGTQLKYYGRPLETNVVLNDLLADGSGQCGTWAQLFIRVLRAQGIGKGEILAVFSADEGVDATGKPLPYEVDPVTNMPRYSWTTGILVKEWNSGTQAFRVIASIRTYFHYK